MNPPEYDLWKLEKRRARLGVTRFRARKTRAA